MIENVKHWSTFIVMATGLLAIHAVIGVVQFFTKDMEIKNADNENTPNNLDK